MEKLLKWLFGDDIFVSYSRADGAAYAAGLANELAKRNFSCRFDQWGSQPGKEIPEALKRALRRSAVLVLVGTPGAAKSAAVGQEIIEFTRLKRVIIPIDFDGAGRRADWWSSIEGLALSEEFSASALKSGKPSPEVVTRIENTFNFTRKDLRLRSAAVLTAVLLILLIASSIIAGIIAGNKAVEAGRKAREAAEQARLAELAKAAATKQQAIAEEQKKIAEDKTIEATTQTRLAENARADAVKQRQIAAEQRREAARQKEIAISRQLLAKAELMKTQGKDKYVSPVELAIEAWRHNQSFEVDSILRYGLDRLPRLTARFPHNSPVTAVAFSPDGDYVSTISSDHIARIWRVSDMKEAQQLRLSDSPELMILSRDGRRLAVSGFKDSSKASTAQVFEITPARINEIAALRHERPIVKLAFSGDGKRLVTASSDQTVKVWELTDGPSTAGITSKQVAVITEVNAGRELNTINFGADGNSVIIQWQVYDEDEDETYYPISIWRVSPLGKLPHGDSGYHYAVSPSGRYIATSKSDTWWVNVVMETEGQDDRGIRVVEDSTVTALSFADDFAVFTASRDKSVRAYDLENSGKELLKIDHDEEVSYINAWPDTGGILTISGERTVHLWRPARGKRLMLYEALRIPHREKLNAISFSASYGRIATASDDGNVYVWEKIWSGSVAGVSYPDSANEWAFSANKRYVSLAGSKTIFVWDTLLNKLTQSQRADFPRSPPSIGDDGKLAAQLAGPLPPQTYVTDLDRDGKNALIRESGSSNAVYFWSAEGGGRGEKQLLDPEVERSILSSSGLYYAVINKAGKFKLWRNGQIDPLVQFDQVAPALTMSDDEKYLAVAFNNKTVKILGVGTWRELASFPTPASVKRLRFSPGGRSLVAFCDGATLVRDMSRGKSVALENQSEYPEWTFSASGRYLAFTVSSGVQVFDTVNFKKVGLFTHSTPVEELAFSPDEKYLATATSIINGKGSVNDDKTIFVWDLATGTSVIRMEFDEDINRVAFSADGRYLLVIRETRADIVIWKPEDLVREAQIRVSQLLQ